MPKIKTLTAVVCSRYTSRLCHVADQHQKIYAGAPMNKQIGDRLAAEGIALIPFYGS